MKDPIQFEDSALPAMNQANSLASPKYLKGLDELLEEMKGKSLVMIIEEGMAYEVRLNRDNNKLNVHFKQISEDRLQTFTNQQIAIYQRTHHVWTTALEVTVSASVAALGFKTPAEVFRNIAAVGQAFEKGMGGFDRSLSNRDKSDDTGVEYSKNIYREAGSESRQLISQGNQTQKELDNISDRARQVISDLIRTIFSSS